MDRNRIADLEAQKWSTHPKTRFPDRLQSPSIDSRIRPATILRHPLDIYLASDNASLQYDVPELKTLALNKIRDELSKCDIVEESFSRFTSK